LFAIDPEAGRVGTTVSVVLSGSHFIDGQPVTINIDNPGVTVVGAFVNPSSNSTGINADFVIAANAPTGVYNVTVTTLGVTTGAVTFTVLSCCEPTLTSISPDSGVGGSTVPVTLTGTNFVPGTTVSVETTAISVSNVIVLSPTQITAAFVIAPNAPWGPNFVFVTTSGGVTGGVTFSTQPLVPTLTSMTPDSFTTGTTVPVTLTGSNLASGDTLSATTGVTVSNVTVVSSTEITATFAIAANAPATTSGHAGVLLTTPYGAEAGLDFSISPPIPTVASITPSSGSLGSTVAVTITGTNFAPGATLYVGAGVLVSSVTVVSATQITATFAISSSAATGPVGVIVETAVAKSQVAVFTINPPPSLITLSPGSLSFSYIQGNIAPSPQSFGVLSAGGAAAYSVSAGTNTGGNWLRVLPGSGQTPGNVSVLLQNLAALSPGTYQGSVTVQPQVSSIAAQTVTVSLQVIAAQPQMKLSTTDLRRTVNNGSPAVAGFVRVLNAGGGTLNYSVTAGAASWLTIGCGAQGSATSSTPGTICVQLSPASLSPATYFDSLTVTAAGQQVAANVTLQVSSSASSILLSSTGMTFTAVAGASAATPASQTVAVLNAGPGTMNWTAQISGSSSWLALSSGSGSSQAYGASQPAITLTPNPAGLAEGDYYALVNVTTPDGSVSNSPAAITVLLKVLPAGSQLSPAVSASGLIFTAPAGGATPAAQQLTLTNGGGSAVGFSLTSATANGQAWLSASPTAGSVAAGGSLPVSVQVNPAGLAPGAYYGQLRFGFSNSTSENVDMLLLVSQPSDTQAPAGSCSQVGLVFDQQVPTDGGAVIAGQPYTLQLKSSCVPSPPSSLNLEIDFSDGTGPLYPAFDSGSGDYEVTWIPSQAESVQLYALSNPVEVPASATGTQPFSVTVAAPDPAGGPVLSAALNSASYATADEVAEGSFISIFGEQLASTQASASGVPFPVQLGGIQATLAGTPLPLYYASADQVNAIVPYLPNQLLDSPQSLVIYRNGVPVSLTLNLIVYQPGIFSTAANGQGQGAIQNASYQLVDASHPAEAGDTIVIYCSGLGPVANPPAAGSVATSGSNTAVTPNVYIDGLEAQVVYSGLSPGSVQLYQVNAIVPPGINSGAVDVYLTITDPRSDTVLQSNTVTIN
jgi:uncharacterized protein (TIGR03437 family)